MRFTKRPILRAAVVAILMAGVWSSAVATSATAQTVAPSQELVTINGGTKPVVMYCVGFLDKLDKYGNSVEPQRIPRSDVCSDKGSNAPALVEARGSVAASTLLVRFYSFADYGLAAWDYYGSEGPCDLYGYGKRDWTRGGGTAASSYQVYNRCNATAIFHDKDYGGVSAYHVGDVPNVGSALNDHIYSFKTWNLTS